MNMSTETNQQSPIAEDLSKMNIAIHLPCARCGYDLRGMGAHGDCPECGEPIRLTIIETIDPASRRLSPIQHPTAVGNEITGIVASFFASTLCVVIALLINAPSTIPTPQFIRILPTSVLLWAAAGFGFLAFLCLAPMMRMCQRKELSGCRLGILMTGSGLLLWSTSMLLVVALLFSSSDQYPTFGMLFDTCLPIVSASIVFSGFRKLIPRLGQRSRAFRQALGSRQRMNDLLAVLVVIIIGRTCIETSPPDSNLAILGLIVMIMSISFIVIGLAYVLRNTFWIRRALITPPPALTELLYHLPESD
jgi:hypothetical protein